MKKEKIETTPDNQPANSSANRADQDSAKRDKEAARADVPASTEKDRWGDLQGQQAGQGSKDR